MWLPPGWRQLWPPPLKHRSSQKRWNRSLDGIQKKIWDFGSTLGGSKNIYRKKTGFFQQIILWNFSKNGNVGINVQKILWNSCSEMMCKCWSDSKGPEKIAVLLWFLEVSDSSSTIWPWIFVSRSSSLVLRSAQDGARHLIIKLYHLYSINSI